MFQVNFSVFVNNQFLEAFLKQFVNRPLTLRVSTPSSASHTLFPESTVYHARLCAEYLVVNVAMSSHLRFCLISEKRVVQFLVVNVDFSEFWSNSLAHFRFHRLLSIFLLQRFSHFHDSSLFDKIWEFKWRLFNTTLSGQIFSLNQVG
jgi:hypothetical protein